VQKFFWKGSSHILIKMLMEGYQSLIIYVRVLILKKLEKEDLLKLYTKKKWLQRSPTFLSVIILKDVDDDEEEEEDSDEDSDGSDSKSDKDSKSGSGSSKSGSDSEDEGSSVPKFQTKLSSTCFTFTNKDRKCLYSGSSWNGTALGSKTKEYTVKIHTSIYGYLMLGFAPKTINKTSMNYNSCGYYMYVCNGTLYSQSGQSGASYSSSFPFSSGQLVGAKLDKKKKE